jgi:hypothetical protein
MQAAKTQGERGAQYPIRKNFLDATLCREWLAVFCVFWSRPLRKHNRRYPAAGTEIPFDFRPHGLGTAHDILKHAINDVLLEDSEVAVKLQVFLQRLQFQACFTWHVANSDGSKIGQTSLGADRGKLGIVHNNFVARELIWPCFDIRKRGVEAGFSVFLRVTGLFSHSSHSKHPGAGATRVANFRAQIA